jgi:hypothetical protein
MRDLRASWAIALYSPPFECVHMYTIPGQKKTTEIPRGLGHLCIYTKNPQPGYSPTYGRCMLMTLTSRKTFHLLSQHLLVSLVSWSQYTVA